jgi:hypothetical protein
MHWMLINAPRSLTRAMSTSKLASSCCAVAKVVLPARPAPRSLRMSILRRIKLAGLLAPPGPSGVTLLPQLLPVRLVAPR